MNFNIHFTPSFRKEQFLAGIEIPEKYRFECPASVMSRSQREKLCRTVGRSFGTAGLFPEGYPLLVYVADSQKQALEGSWWPALINPEGMTATEILAAWENDYDAALLVATEVIAARQNELGKCAANNLKLQGQFLRSPGSAELDLPMWILSLDLLHGYRARISFTCTLGDQPEDNALDSEFDDRYFELYFQTESRSDGAWGECLVHETGSAPSAGRLIKYPKLTDALDAMWPVQGTKLMSAGFWNRCIENGFISQKDAETIQITLANMLSAPWPDHISPLPADEKAGG